MLTVPARSSRMQRAIARQSKVQTPLESAYGVALATAIASSRPRTRMIGATGPNVSRRDQRHVRRDVVEHRRRSAARRRARRRRAAARPTATASADPRRDALRGSLVDHRADVGRPRRSGSPQASACAPLGDPPAQLVGDLLDGDDPLDRGAALAGVRERAAHRERRRPPRGRRRRARSAGRCRRARARRAGSRAARRSTCRPRPRR